MWRSGGLSPHNACECGMGAVCVCVVGRHQREDDGGGVDDRGATGCSSDEISRLALVPSWHLTPLFQMQQRRQKKPPSAPGHHKQDLIPLGSRRCTAPGQSPPTSVSPHTTGCSPHQPWSRKRNWCTSRLAAHRLAGRPRSTGRDSKTPSGQTCTVEIRTWFPLQT